MLSEKKLSATGTVRRFKWVYPPNAAQLQKPFRFLDLPRELRDKIYDIGLVAPKEYRKTKRHWMEFSARSKTTKQYLWQPPTLALKIVYGEVLWADHPDILAVSRQIREEADEFWWGKNEWLVNLDIKQPVGEGYRIESNLYMQMGQTQRWVDKMGMHRLRHLRVFTLKFETCYKTTCCDEQFRVVLDSTHGLQLVHSTYDYYESSMHEAAIGWHLAATELRRKSNGWKGEGIIDFFLHEKDFWSRWQFLAYPEEDHHEPWVKKYVEEEAGAEGDEAV